MDNKIYNFFPNTKLYMTFIAILLGVLFYYNYKLGIIGLIFYTYLIYYNLRINKIRHYEFSKFVEDLSANIDTAGKNTLSKIPIPLVIIDNEGKILWANALFYQSTKVNLYGKDVKDFIPTFDIQNFLNVYEKVTIKDRVFNVFVSPVETEKEKRRVYFCCTL